MFDLLPRCVRCPRGRAGEQGRSLLYETRRFRHAAWPSAHISASRKVEIVLKASPLNRNDGSAFRQRGCVIDCLCYRLSRRRRAVVDLNPMPSSTRASESQRAIAVVYGISCHVLFSVAVATMIMAMFFGMSRSLGQVPAPWSALVNALLLAQFPFLHSLLLSPFGATLLTRLAPAAFASRLATTTYAIVASIQVLLLFALWTPSGVIWWHAEGAMLWFLGALYLASWLLLLKAIWDAGIALQTGFLGWWAVANRRAPVFPPMPTTGLFRIVRQPIYVAFALTVWTVPTWTPDQLALAVVLAAYCLIGPLLKERRFRLRFGQNFLAYADQVPYWAPWPRPPTKRNDLSIYDASADWWGGKTRWLRTLQNLIPARFAFFDPIVGGWRGKAVRS